MARKVTIGRKEVGRMNTGSVAVGASVVDLSTNTAKLTGGVQVTAAPGNTDVVFVGVRADLTAGTAAATDGYPLSAGDTIFLPVRSENEVKLIADAAAQTAYFASY